MGRRRMGLFCAVVAAAVGLATPARVGATAALKATLVQTLTQPVAMTTRPGEPNSVYIAQKNGTVRRLLLGGDGSVTLDATVVLNLHAAVATNGPRGLLGIAFNPAGTKFYASYITTAKTVSRLSEFPFGSGKAKKVKERVVLEFSTQDKAQHLGGTIAFGPDGLLYMAIGDGGISGATVNTAQDPSSLLGKILRIDPKATSTQPYTVPASNPFVGQAGARPEIFHLGLRNPWKFSFDRSTGDQWIGDVGETSLEEVDHVGPGVSGANFGWNLREGDQPYNGGDQPEDNVDPVYEYPHENGNCAITGGYVYRGTAIADLAGDFVFSDFCSGVIQALHSDGTVDSFVTVSQPVSFGEDSHGELWVLSLGGGVYRLDPS